VLVGALLPGGADGFDLGGVLEGGGVVDDEDFGTFAGWGGLRGTLPLAVDVDDGEAGGKARGDFSVEEVAPLGLGSGDLGGVGVGGPEAEVEAGVDPVLGVGGVIV